MCVCVCVCVVPGLGECVCVWYLHVKRHKVLDAGIPVDEEQDEGDQVQHPKGVHTDLERHHLQKENT